MLFGASSAFNLKLNTYCPLERTKYTFSEPCNVVADLQSHQLQLLSL